MVRRPTGGRAVLHEQEVTYSLIVPQPETLFPPDILGSYRLISQALIRGLSFLGVEATLEPPRRQGTSSHSPSCFHTLSSYEIAVGGRKLIGSAQRRLRGGLLQQGSLLLQLDIPRLFSLLRFPDQARREEGIRQAYTRMTSLAEVTGRLYPHDTVQAALVKGFQAELGIEFQDGELTPEERQLRDRLLQEKYRTVEWNLYGRQPSASLP
ncbi:MAG: lipoate--protein ligase family protein [Nitrospinota bacterium]|nr:MAG: lipoate--protein ligase family protein [Nitrospinota bacterium]